ncbi:hypothetical protein, partial [Luteipulveratus flavus]
RDALRAGQVAKDRAITEQWWRLAGHVADEWTAEAVATCRDALRAGQVAKDRAITEQWWLLAGHVADDDVVSGEQDKRKRTTESILARLAEAGDDGLSWSSLRVAHRRARETFDALLGTVERPGPLVESGQVRLDETTGRGAGGVRVYAGEAQDVLGVLAFEGGDQEGRAGLAGECQAVSDSAN